MPDFRAASFGSCFSLDDLRHCDHNTLARIWARLENGVMQRRFLGPASREKTKVLDRLATWKSNEPGAIMEMQMTLQ